MKISRFFLAGFLLSTLHISDARAQVYDFDSLVSHNEKFKNAVEVISDTLDLFNDQSLLKVTLETDFKNLIRGRKNPEYQPATFRMMLNDTVMVTREIKIKPRGHSRRRVCYIPPLKLNFPKKKAFLKQLQSFDKIKLVLACKSSESYEQYLLAEYYIYKIYNMISEYSLRVRLLELNYIDTSGKLKPMKKYSFIIEDIDQMAARHNAVRIDTSVYDPLTYLPTLADVYLFQYMIGNTDWSIPGLHNIYLIKSKDINFPKPIVVPYDFDYAGIVNATYAVPDPQLEIETVRERVYRGRCIDAELLRNSARKFKERKSLVLGLYENDKYLNKGFKKSTISYLKDFYSIIENDKVFEREILDKCRK